MSTPGRPYVRRGWWYTTLHFQGAVTQSRMLTLWPDVLQVGYTRSMMGGLLLRPGPREIGIVGLGGGSQAKFCYRHLPQAGIEAFEIDPDVLALRRAFRIPDDDARFRTVLGDAARLLRQRRDRYDLLLVDAYDPQGIPAALSSAAFYADCRDALAEGGVVACNLYATDVKRHLARMRRAFAGNVLAVHEPRMSNVVAFGWRGELRQVSQEEALARLPRAARRQLSGVFARVAAALARRPAHPH
ncbi:transferase [Pseudoxanthomonas putridarboris]|uniref:Transferase n=1 Tax=Pseudoxanthomonas putridarboris TaxID=752605 RepID=A0ABU9J130_9GAMM